MKREQFISQYVTNFVATWTAQNYDQCCAMGRHDVLRNPPVEDAIDLATQLWEKMKEDGLSRLAEFDVVQH
jgi:hypothetical protein